jgi:hypothetical protein
MSNHQIYEWYLYKNLYQCFCVKGLAIFNDWITLHDKNMSKTPNMLIIAVTKMIFSTNRDNKKGISLLYELIRRAVFSSIVHALSANPVAFVGVLRPDSRARFRILSPIVSPPPVILDWIQNPASPAYYSYLITHYHYCSFLNSFTTSAFVLY